MANLANGTDIAAAFIFGTEAPEICRMPHRNAGFRKKSSRAEPD
jgi:hypothetical protein